MCIPIFSNPNLMLIPFFPPTLPNPAIPLLSSFRCLFFLPASSQLIHRPFLLPSFFLYTFVYVYFFHSFIVYFSSPSTFYPPFFSYLPSSLHCSFSCIPRTTVTPFLSLLHSPSFHAIILAFPLPPQNLLPCIPPPFPLHFSFTTPMAFFLHSPPYFPSLSRNFTCITELPPPSLLCPPIHVLTLLTAR